MTLQDQGYRYMVNRDIDRYGWFHPAEIESLKQSGWVDCTDMPNAELEAFFKGD